MHKRSSSKKRTLLNGRYQIITDLNHGSYGVVSLVKDTLNANQLFAIKGIDKKAGDDEKAVSDEVNHEIFIHKKIGDHNNVAKLVDWFETSKMWYLVMEYYSGGDLYEAIKAQRGPREQGNISGFMRQLIDAVQYAHSRGIFHRDIKPENILIAADGTLKLADWGLATAVRKNKEFGVGSERYMAPELLDKNTTQYDAAQTDIWAVGVCLLNILFGRNPFTVASQKDKLFMDFATSREALFDIFPTLSTDVFSVLRHSLTIDPDNRSLERMKQDLAKVEVWNTDDYDYDYDEVEDQGFREEDAAVPEVIVTTTNRQPFRTPTAFGVVRLEAFGSWNRTMQFTPPVQDSLLRGRLSSSSDRPSSKLNEHTPYLDAFDESQESIEDDGEFSDESLDMGDDQGGLFTMDQDSHHTSLTGTISFPESPSLEQRLANMDINNQVDNEFGISPAPSLVQPGLSSSNEGRSIDGSLKRYGSTMRSNDIGFNTKEKHGRTTGSMPQSVPTRNQDIWKFSRNWSDDDLDDDLDNDEYFEMLAASLPSSSRSTEESRNTGSSKTSAVSVAVRSSPVNTKLPQSWLFPTEWREVE